MEYLKIEPVIVGELSWLKSPNEVATGRIYFAMGYNKETPKGHAFAILCGPVLSPVSKSNGEPLIFEGYAGLTCTYDKINGTLKDFFV